MKYVKWLFHGLLVIAFGASGVMKLIIPYEEMLTDPNMQWVEDFTATQIKIIASLEILGALGLLLPYIVRGFKWVIPLAAIGLAATMVGAALTHITRGEYAALVPNVVLFIMAALTAYWRRDFFKNQKSPS